MKLSLQTSKIIWEMANVFDSKPVEIEFDLEPEGWSRDRVMIHIDDNQYLVERDKLFKFIGALRYFE